MKPFFCMVIVSKNKREKKKREMNEREKRWTGQMREIWEWINGHEVIWEDTLSLSTFTFTQCWPYFAYEKNKEMKEKKYKMN